MRGKGASQVAGHLPAKLGEGGRELAVGQLDTVGQLSPFCRSVVVSVSSPIGQYTF